MFITRQRCLLVAMLLLAATAAFAQWAKLPVQAAPKTSSGEIDLHAAAPKRADGSPDFSGIWQAINGKYLNNLAADIKPGDLPIQPWAQELTNERKTGAHAAEEPQASCLPPGLPRINATPLPLKIYQMPGVVVILYEAYGIYRQVFLDGRVPVKDANPAWLGYSTGRYEGDALVVDTVGLNGKTWLDQTGHPATESLHVTERFRRREFGRLEIETTIDDPKAYTKPWTAVEPLELLPGTELIEFVCNENERDMRHLPGK